MPWKAWGFVQWVRIRTVNNERGPDTWARQRQARGRVSSLPII